MVFGTRGAGYGLDAELARKQEAKYNPVWEREVQEWIEAVTGERFTQPFADELKSGVTLSRLINKIKPGSVTGISKSSMPFSQMENISKFLRACRGLGMAEYDCFETVDLFEQKDMGVVVMCIQALARTAQTVPSFGGPRLGSAASTKNFTKQTIASKSTARGSVADAYVARLREGSADATARSTHTTTSSDIGSSAKSASRNAADGSSVRHRRKHECPGCGVGGGTGGAVPRLNNGSAGIMDRTHVTTSNDIGFGAKSAGRGAADASVPKLNNGSAGIMQRTHVSRNKDITFGRDATGGSNRGTSGAVPRLNNGSAGIMDRTHVTTSNDIGFGAKSAGRGAPGASVPKLNNGSAGIMERTHVSNNNDITFGRDATIGGKGASGAVPRLNYGSAGIMDRTHVTTSNDIGFGAKSAGRGAADASVPKLNNGSAGIMERTHVSRNKDITFGRDATGGSNKGTSGEVPRLNNGSAGIMDRTHVTTSNDIGFGAKSAGRGAAGASVPKLNNGSAGIMQRTHISRNKDITFGRDAGAPSGCGTNLSGGSFCQECTTKGL